MLRNKTLVRHLYSLNSLTSLVEVLKSEISLQEFDIIPLLSSGVNVVVILLFLSQLSFVDFVGNLGSSRRMNFLLQLDKMTVLAACFWTTLDELYLSLPLLHVQY